MTAIFCHNKRMRGMRFFVFWVVLIALSVLTYGVALAQGPYVGEIRMFTGSTAPSGWLFANGQAISRTQYADLFSVIGTTFGAGDGSSTFNLPDLVSKFPLGTQPGLICAPEDFCPQLADTGGEIEHTLTTSEMPQHDHQPLPQEGGRRFLTRSNNGGLNMATVGGAFNLYAVSTTDTTGGGQPHNNMPPYVVVYYIIAYEAGTGGGPTPTPTPTPTVTPTPTSTPTITPTPVEPGIYTHTLNSGYQMTVPTQVTFGQLMIAGILLAIIALIVLDFFTRVVYR